MYLRDRSKSACQTHSDSDRHPSSPLPFPTPIVSATACISCPSWPCSVHRCSRSQLSPGNGCQLMSLEERCEYVELIDWRLKISSSPLSVVDSTAPTAQSGLAFSSGGAGTCSAEDTLMKSFVSGGAEDAACRV
jgi:hypothetical protein